MDVALVGVLPTRLRSVPTQNWGNLTESWFTLKRTSRKNPTTAKPPRPIIFYPAQLSAIWRNYRPARVDSQVNGRLFCRTTAANSQRSPPASHRLLSQISRIFGRQPNQFDLNRTSPNRSAFRRTSGSQRLHPTRNPPFPLTIYSSRPKRSLCGLFFHGCVVVFYQMRHRGVGENKRSYFSIS